MRAARVEVTPTGRPAITVSHDVHPSATLPFVHSERTEEAGPRVKPGATEDERMYQRPLITHCGHLARSSASRPRKRPIAEVQPSCNKNRMSYVDRARGTSWSVRLQRALAALLGLSAAVATLPLALMAMASAMLFDAPGSEGNGLLWALALGFVLAPILTGYAAYLCALSILNDSWRELLRAAILVAGICAYLGGISLMNETWCGGQTVC